MEDTIILAIESSCDETAVAIIKNGHQILSNVVSTQLPFTAVMAALCRKLPPASIWSSSMQWCRRL